MTSNESSTTAQNPPNCRESKACEIIGECSLQKGACMALKDEDCNKSEMCKQYGMCRAVSSRCVPLSDADCRNSSSCKTHLNCEFYGNDGPTSGVCLRNKRFRGAQEGEASCKSVGGLWRDEGMATLPYRECVVPTGDAGKACNDSSECESECIDHKCFGSNDVPLNGCGFIEKGEATCRNTKTSWTLTPEIQNCRDGIGCKVFGACVYKVGVGCQPGSDADCARSEHCKGSGECSFQNGACAALKDDDCNKSRLCGEFGMCHAHINSMFSQCTPLSDDDCLNTSTCKDWKNCEFYERKVTDSRFCVRSKKFARAEEGEKVCKAIGGQWRGAKREAWQSFCLAPTSDAGKACTDRSECESDCIDYKCLGTNDVPRDGCGFIVKGKSVCNHPNPTRSLAEMIVDQMRGISMQTDATVRSNGTINPEGMRRTKISWELHLQGKQSVPALIRALSDADVQMRKNAELMLIDLAGNYLREGSPKIDIREAVPALINATEDHDPVVRAWAAHALAEVRPGAKEAIPALLKLLKDPEVGPRNNSCIALGRMGTVAQEALPALREALKDPSNDVRQFARKAINSIEK